ncbi:MAG: hypothetical protein PHU85_15765, partial [Phycisphaerae bacterium]|nr:hypothetical protein [Phycisphaerae bacterium]
VQYTDNFQIDPTTLGPTDVVVTGPGGFGQPATFQEVSVSADGKMANAVYRISSPLQNWQSSDNGVYTVTVNPGEVADTAGNTVTPPVDLIGPFTFTIALETNAPTASANMADVPDVATPGQTSYQFIVNYTDDTRVRIATFDDDDIYVMRDDGAMLNARFVGMNTGSEVDGSLVQAVYEITPPGGSWDSFDIGHWTAYLRSGQVADTYGNVAAGAAIGSFDVGDVVPPTASTSATLPSIGYMQDSYGFQVHYLDNIAMKTSTISNGDVVVTGPNGYSQPATVAHVDSMSNGPRRTGSYSITGLNGDPFDASYNGIYSVDVLDGAVRDTSDNLIVGGVLEDTAGDPVKMVVNIPTVIANDVIDVNKDPERFTVIYSSYFLVAPTIYVPNWATDRGIDTASIDGNDVIVTGPNNYRGAASVVGAPTVTQYNDTVIGTDPVTGVDIYNRVVLEVSVVYQVQPPSPTQGWTENYAGEYDISVNPNEVLDQGRSLGGGKVGVFNCVIGDYPFGVAQAPNLLNLNDALGHPLTTYTFKVRYVGNNKIAFASMDSNDVVVSGALLDGTTVTLPATLVGAPRPAGNGSPRVATYQITAPGGTWDAADRGTYTVQMQGDQVTDILGHPVSAGDIGSFVVGDVTPPSVFGTPPWVLVTGMTTSIDFWAVYSDNDAVKASTIGAGDITLMGPNNFLRSADMTLLDSPVDGARRMVQYGTTLPGGREWNANDNGSYTAFVETDAIEDVNGNAITGGTLKDQTNNDMAILVDIPVLAAPDIMFTNSNPYQFIVTYSDFSLIDPVLYGVQGIDPASLDNNDIVVTARIGQQTYNQNATLVNTFLLNYDATAGVYTQVAGVYTVGAPMWIGQWNEQAAGEYTVTIQQGEITSPAGYTMAGTKTAGDKIGSFNVRIGDYPVGSLTATDVLTLPSGEHTFQIAWYDDTAINTATLGIADVEVVGPGGVVMPVTFVGVDQPNPGSPRVATYSVAPAGGIWTTADIGEYTISVNADQVYDNDGNSAPAMVLGTFSVGDVTKPTANVYMANNRFTGIQNSIQFIVRYADNVAIDVSMLDSGDVRVLGPNSFNEPALFRAVDITTDGPSRLVTYEVTPADGSFDFFDNGVYRFAIQGDQVADTWGNYVTLLTAPLFTVDIPQLVVTNINAVNSLPHQFSVIYNDPFGNGLNVTTLSGTDLRVTGPGGYNQMATLVSYVVVNQTASPAGMLDTQVMATYTVPPPAVGQWDITNGGMYSVTLNPNEVTDMAGREVAHGLLGTFRNRVGDDPTVLSPIVIPDVLTSTGGAVQFNVTYSDNVAIDLATLGDNDVRVTGPGGFVQLAHLAAAVPSGGGKTVVATYEVTSADGLWNHKDNGVYLVAFVGGSVADTSANPVVGPATGLFTVNVPSPDPTPTVGVTAVNISVKGATTYTFTASFDDDLAVDVSTIGDDDFLVTGPNGFSTFATLVPGSISPPTDSAAVTADYQFTPPGGFWDAADVGAYTITLQPNSVLDTDAPVHAVPTGVADTFFVNISVPMLGRFGNK